MNGLPEEFLLKMRSLLKDEYKEFVEAYKAPKNSAFRINTLKISSEGFARISPFEIEPIEEIKEGYYYSTEEQPGKHPYHSAGLYYIQEPSAMMPVKALDVQPGEIVLDLCAAPGGKSTQIACALKGEGLLVSNEIISSRASILAENMERFGVKNAIITNESPDRLSKHFNDFFDKVLVDAPCSGEGMFRKEPYACSEWNTDTPVSCAKRQLNILDDAQKMLKSGGKLVYSTCTFSPEENEGVIKQFLQRYTEFDLCDISGLLNLERGRPEWVNGTENLMKCRRIWPHKYRGEGHFAALLKKSGTALENSNYKSMSVVDKKNLELYLGFQQENLLCSLDGNLSLFGDHLYLVSNKVSHLKGVKLIRPGLHLGIFKKNRFEPSHSLAMALRKKDFIRSVSYTSDSKEILKYLRGETLEADIENGWTAVLVDGYPLGWGKVVGGTLKNHYPKGLRINY
ncbi:RsmF rRNA methyltransferase first C-terminal domain-containing protein [Petroclostridium sp. X23]|uniref:RsmF rRNA methyltransferase first C-terminal domain-containing protein n=1 Tax=Petroclostridium sp. X23 TaxID=3045146 RepID=UPI0024AD0888|nr:RsmF rRNA methyltransferase first C-terminal domain-containing protein [Petroclostridium sp. X23]WHH59235.1 RsmF rRNA methyltransferase first C-terminal domain-containing protein [Petroclostridium sp. X23]